MREREEKSTNKIQVVVVGVVVANGRGGCCGCFYYYSNELFVLF